MLKQYRRNFIILNMITTGIVLLAAFIIIGVEVIGDSNTEQKNLMQVIVKSFKTPSESTDPPVDSKQQSADKKNPPEKKSEKPEKKSGQTETVYENSSQNDYSDENIVTILYDKKADSISVLSESTSYNGDIKTVAKEIANQNDSFGTLEKFHVTYYKERFGNVYKIAVIDTMYMGYIHIRIIIVLFSAYVFSMALVLLLSYELSKISAKPMEDAINRERQFVADISHDLKTPITVIMANNSILKANPDATISENRQWIDSTDTASRDMMQLVSEMLMLSKLESEEKKKELEMSDISSVVEKTVLQMESIAYERGITIESDISEGIEVLSAEEYLNRICGGLIDNAVKYEPDGGKVSVKLTYVKKKVLLEVKNYSTVISEEDMPYIFDRFYRGDKTRTKSGGHGLGLPIIKRMAGLSNAKILAESTQEKGTVFSVIFEC